jgi:hypothetical protein
MSWHHLSYATGSVFKIDKSPTLTFTGIDTYVDSVIDVVKHIHLNVWGTLRLSRKDNASIRI